MKKIFLPFIVFVCSFLIEIQPTYASTSKTAPCQISFQIELQNWDVVKETLPRKSIFTVIDVDSGKSFEVQRRAGSGHADVQPLTRKDTKIMKEIYDGKWSWKRRAVLILSQDRLIPASMHGMPHGGGALQNGFPGHFCIHFSGSKTHRTGRLDLSHHVMILKAAGRIDDYINSLPPTQLLNVFLVTVKNGDINLAKKMAISKNRNIEETLKKIEKIEAIQWTVSQANEQDATSFATNIPAEVNLFLKNIGPVKTNLTFTLVRTSPLSAWKVNIDPLFSNIQ